MHVQWLGYIDLSKRRVSATDIVKCEERYNKSKAVHSIMSTVAKKENKDLEVLYEQLAWPLYAKYGHAYDAFKAALKYVSLIWLSAPLLVFSWIFRTFIFCSW